MAASTLAMLSGKGGAGKTSLSLMLASMMSASGFKTLLVDCDMSTHGLTYFFEGELNKEVLSLVDCVGLSSESTSYDKKCPDLSIDLDGLSELTSYDKKDSDLSLIPVDELCFCIPSIYRVTDETDYNKTVCERAIRWIVSTYSDDYDMIIFDGQAGYSPFVQAIANVSDAILFVMELDSVTVSATRVLYRKLCMESEAEINEQRLFQVINKLDGKDKEIFSKVITGTMFTNLSPVSFDWSIRRAFAECHIPSMSYTNNELLLNISSIMKQMFPGFRKQINQHFTKETAAIVEKLSMRAKALEMSIQHTKQKNKRRRIIFIVFFVSVIGSITLPVITDARSIGELFVNLTSSVFELVCLLLLLPLLLGSVLNLSLDKRTKHDESSDEKSEYDAIMSQIAELEALRKEYS